MSEQQNSLMIWLVWLHGAILIIPALVLMAKLESEEFEKMMHSRLFYGWRFWHTAQPGH